MQFVSGVAARQSRRRCGGGQVGVDVLQRQAINSTSNGAPRCQTMSGSSLVASGVRQVTAEPRTVGLGSLRQGPRWVRRQRSTPGSVQRRQGVVSDPCWSPCTIVSSGRHEGPVDLRPPVFRTRSCGFQRWKKRDDAVGPRCRARHRRPSNFPGLPDGRRIRRECGSPSPSAGSTWWRSKHPYALVGVVIRPARNGLTRD